MLISTKHLRKAGVHILAQENGRDLKGDLYLEISLENGKPLSPEFHDEIAERVGPEVAEALIEAFVSKVNGLQLAELIHKTEHAAWRDRSGHRVAEYVDEPFNKKK